MLNILLLVLAVAGDEPASLPKALALLQSRRGALVTGEVEWSLEDRAAPGAQPRMFTSRFASQDCLQVDWDTGPGDAGRRLAARRMLETGDEQWITERDSSLTALLFRHKRWLMPMRTLGVAGMAAGVELEEIVRGDPSHPVEYTVIQKGPIHEVVADRGNYAVHWWIDVEKDGFPLRVRVEVNGEFVREAVSTPQKFGDTWYPAEVEYFERGHQGGREPTRVVRVHRASFNQSAQTLRLTPEDIGVDVGTTVLVYDKPGGAPKGPPMSWTGEKLLPLREVARLLADGKLQPGPRFEFDRQIGSARYGTSIEGIRREWTGIVKACIARYALSTEQSERAWAILADCLEKANQYLTRNATDIEKLSRELLALKPGVDQDNQRLATLTEKLDRYRQEVMKIRDESLLPRLKEIPSRSQREAARPPPESNSGKQPASRP